MSARRGRTAATRTGQGTYHDWHVFVPDVWPGQIYGYRARGPSDAGHGAVRWRQGPSRPVRAGRGRARRIPARGGGTRRQHRHGDEERGCGPGCVRLATDPGRQQQRLLQDNEISWFDWTLLATHADVHRFVTLLTARRRLRDTEHEVRRVSLTEMIETANKAWHGVALGQPDWRDDSHSVAFTMELRREGILVHIILNAYWEPLDFALPPVSSGDGWRQWIDTALDSPDDIVPWENAAPVAAQTYRAEPRSAVVLSTAKGAL
jgi:pullulanase/glycogen debranching enzyme